MVNDERKRYEKGGGKKKNLVHLIKLWHRAREKAEALGKPELFVAAEVVWLSIRRINMKGLNPSESKRFLNSIWSALTKKERASVEAQFERENKRKQRKVEQK